MTTNSRARIAGILVASSALFAASNIAYANGQGSPIEPEPAPAPTVLEPAAPAPMAPAPAPKRTSNWSGLYIGGHLGYGWSAENDDETFLFDTDLDGGYGDTVFTSAVPPVNAFGPGFCGGAATSTANTACDDDEGGIDAGLRLGYDWDFGGFVLGGLIEGSYNDISDSVSGFSTTPASYTMTRELNYLLAARLRAGFAFDNFLIYGTGGYAYGDVDRTFTTTNTANTFTPFNDDGIDGYQLGGGAEYMISDSLSFGVEYLYTDLKDDEYFVAVGPGTADPATNPFLQDNPAGTNIGRSDDSFDIHSVRATLNYRFGG
ncbi:MAG: outer membrane beta-barrel protein [Micropepsaceae bacterium]